MKNLIFFFFVMITTCGFSQAIIIDSISIVKPGLEEVTLDTSVTNHLEAFKDKDDAIVYILRLGSMVGALAVWQVKVDDTFTAKMKQKEYVVVHVNTAVKGHYFYYPDMRYNYTNFKPNKYYYVILNSGFNLKTGYLTAEVFSKIKSFRIAKSVTK